MRAQTLERQKGIEVLKEACAACGEAIATKKGRMIIKDEARVVRGPIRISTKPMVITTAVLLCGGGRVHVAQDRLHPVELTLRS
jgi:hypothetical protein